MNVDQAIETKRAVRLFEDKTIPKEIVLAILDAGRRSQSSQNSQPWQFVVIQDREKLQLLSKMGQYAEHLAGAAFAVALVGAYPAADFDLGQAAAYIQLRAWELGVGSCIATIHDSDRAKTNLHIPSEMRLTTMISFGYPSPGHKPAKLGGRKPIEEVVCWETWG